MNVRVGRYEILEIIGSGAHGRVARAHDPMIGRLVAIKLFPKELASGEARQRFLQEARVVGQLSHPSIITLHDMGIGEAACALGVAHRKGVIHGDVKPANMLITDDGHVKLMDFGMARLASRDTGATPLLGTPAYWCPEQIMGKPQDARSDLFSLGVVLYEMVTGQRPFDADSLQGICGRVLSSTPLPPSHSNPSVPAVFDDLVARCLAKDPAARYQAADAIAEELYPLARRKPATPVPVPQTNGHGLRDRAARLLRSA